MPQSLVKNYVQITFSTKNHFPLISDSIKKRFFNYLGGTCNELTRARPQYILASSLRTMVYLL